MFKKRCRCEASLHCVFLTQKWPPHRRRPHRLHHLLRHFTSCYSLMAKASRIGFHQHTSIGWTMTRGGGAKPAAPASSHHHHHHPGTWRGIDTTRDRKAFVVWARDPQPSRLFLGGRGRLWRWQMGVVNPSISFLDVQNNAKAAFLVSIYSLDQRASPNFHWGSGSPRLSRLLVWMDCDHFSLPVFQTKE